MMILYNAIQTPDGFILESFHRHDFKTHTDEDGRGYMVDGGLDYLRRGGEGYTDLSLTTEDKFENIRKRFSWGSYGKNLDEELHWVRLKDLTVEHMQAVLDSEVLQKHIEDLFVKELKFRENQDED